MHEKPLINVLILHVNEDIVNT